MAKQRLEQPRGAEEVEAGVQALPRREALVNIHGFSRDARKTLSSERGLQPRRKSKMELDKPSKT